MDIFKKPVSYEATVQTRNDDLPDLKDTKVIITKDGDDVIIAVKGVYRKFTRDGDCFFAKAEQVGDYHKLDNTKTLAEAFDCLKRMLERVSAMVEAGSKGEPIEGDKINGDQA